ncbi:hypothetical protein Tco_0179089 [Tanacetum coccineum]
MDAEVISYFDECVSISAFDSFDASPAEDPYVGFRVGSEIATPTRDPSPGTSDIATAAEHSHSDTTSDNRRKPLEFKVKDRVLLKASPWKGVMHFRKKGKLAPSVHDTFHVSNLKKCLADANLHVPQDDIKIDKTLRFVEEPVEIMDREVKSLKRRCDIDDKDQALETPSGILQTTFGLNWDAV